MDWKFVPLLPQNSYVEILTPTVIRKWGLWKVVRSWGWDSQELGLVPLEKTQELAASSALLSAIWGVKEKALSGKQEARLPQMTDLLTTWSQTSSPQNSEE